MICVDFMQEIISEIFRWGLIPPKNLGGTPSRTCRAIRQISSQRHKGLLWGTRRPLNNNSPRSRGTPLAPHKRATLLNRGTPHLKGTPHNRGTPRSKGIPHNRGIHLNRVTHHTKNFLPIRGIPKMGTQTNKATRVSLTTKLSTMLIGTIRPVSINFSLAMRLIDVPIVK